MDYKETYEKILEEYRQVFERVDQQNMREFIDEVKAHDRIFLIGVGREGMGMDVSDISIISVNVQKKREL